MNVDRFIAAQLAALALLAGCKSSNPEPPKSATQSGMTEVTSTTTTSGTGTGMLSSGMSGSGSTGSGAMGESNRAIQTSPVGATIPTPTPSPPRASAPPPAPAPMAPMPPPTMTTEGTGALGSTAPAMPQRSTSLSDAEIAGIAHAANVGEIEMARLAQKTSQNAQVKSFAAMIITDHTNAEMKAKTILTTAKVSPIDDDISRKLKSDTDETISSLKDQKGKEFDVSYIDAQIKGHREVLTTLDEKILPSVQNAELKGHLTDVRKRVADHLAKAEEIKKTLGGAPATK